MPLGLVLTQPVLAIKPKAFLIRESVYACGGWAERRKGGVRGEEGKGSTGTDSSNDPHLPHTSMLGSDSASRQRTTE